MLRSQLAQTILQIPHRDFVETAQITLPLSQDGSLVDMLLLVADYSRREFPPTR